MDSSSIEYSEDEAPADSVKYLVSLRHQYDELLKEGELARERLRKFKDLERDVTEWSGVFGFGNDQVDNKQIRPQEGADPKRVDFVIPVRPYENDPGIPHGVPNGTVDDSD
jgi:hypothetical protein